MGENFRTIIADMPFSVKGTVGYDAANDYYTIYINGRYSQNQQLLTYFHELKHIENEDILKSGMNVGAIEKTAHKKRKKF